MNPSTDWKEVIAPDESARFSGYVQRLRAMQQGNARNGKPWRALHAKALAGAEAEFSVLPNLPEHARVGLFKTPATYKAYVRYSSGSARPQADQKPDVRGFALKVVGLPAEGTSKTSTQDFLGNRGASIPFRNTQEFVNFVLAAQKPLWLLPKLFWHFGLRGTFRVLGRLVKSLKEPPVPLAQMPFHSELPIKFGAYAARFAFFPASAATDAAQDRTSRDYLGEDLGSRLRQGPVDYDFKVQFFVDEVRTPIEDGSVEWLEQDAPFITVARLRLTQQDFASARGRSVSSFIEGLSFNPWNASEDFRPLGDLMRSRRLVYQDSSLTRQGQGEPDGRESFAA